MTAFVPYLTLKCHLYVLVVCKLPTNITSTSSAPPNLHSSAMFATPPSQGNPGKMPEQPSCASYILTPAGTNSELLSFEFPVPPSPGKPEVMPKYPQSPQDTRTSPLNQTLPEIAAIPHLMAGGSSSQPDPMKDPLSPCQLWKQQQAEWFPSCEEQEKTLEARFYESRLSGAMWSRHSEELFDRAKEKDKKIWEQAADIKRLIVRSSPLLVFLLFLTRI